MGIESALHTQDLEATCMHTHIHTHMHGTKVGILHKRVKGWYPTVPQTWRVMDMMDQSPSLFNQDISHQSGWGAMGKVTGEVVGVRGEGGGQLEALYGHI